MLYFSNGARSSLYMSTNSFGLCCTLIFNYVLGFSKDYLTTETRLFCLNVCLLLEIVALYKLL